MYIFQSEHLKRRDHLEDVGISGRVILELILDKLGIRVYSGFTWLRIEPLGRLL
jgi:hypothetical protein